VSTCVSVPKTQPPLAVSCRPLEKEEEMSNGPSRPWFGPKRVGYGLRPQTWQGWALILAVVIVVVVLIWH
jgi:hypothetical protein